MPFAYYDDAQNRIVTALSSDRLSAYLAATQRDTLRAIRLYEHNTRLSESLYGVLQGFEVPLRNSFHNVMRADLGHDDWYDRVSFDAKEAKSVADAKANIQKWQKAVTPGRVVAELTFGFWVRLVAPSYEKMLWVPHLYKAFPLLKKPDRRSVFTRLESIRKLRNRIAHHEPIFTRYLKGDYDAIIEAIGWICPVTAAWVGTHNSFVARGFR